MGVTVNQGTVQIDNKKVKKVKNWQQLTNVTEVWRFLGFTGYYQYFIQDYSHIARLLLDLTIKTTPWHWGNDQQKLFEQLWNQMCEKPVLQQPDFTKKFFVHLDALAYGVRAILSQEGESSTSNPSKPCLHPVAYYLATFTATERNYDIYECELLAILKAITHWRPYLI